MSSFTQESRTRILSQLRAHQSERWERGERVLVEELLTSHPAVAEDAAVLLELVQSEIIYRLRRGEHVSLEEYQQRFAQHADKLSELWPHIPSGLPTLDLEGWSLKNTISEPTSPGAPSAVAAPALPGFELHQKLGQGGMGVVYHARDLRLDQPRAIKFIRTGPLADEDTHNRFNREAKAVARLDHPGVVRIFSQGEYGDTLYICMEFLEGGNLQSRLRQGPFEVRIAADLVRQLALAIQHAHDNDVLHRDLKPSNVLLTTAGVPKVSDFGLAKLLDEQDDLTQAGAVMGTTGYMAPEQAESRLGEVREPADIWALGVILYECLTGSLPFKGGSRSETLEMVKHRPPTPPRKLRAEVPAELEAICLKCLQKQPAQRYASAGKLAEDLQAWLAGRSVNAPIASGRRRRWFAVVGAGILFAGLASGVFFLPPDNRDDKGKFPPPDVQPPPVVEAPLKSGDWITLLRRAPVKLRWPTVGDNSFEFSAEKRELRLSCFDLGLLSLGETKAPRFQIELTMAQTPWNGNIGIFVGYQPCVVANKPGHRCQLLEILPVPTKDKGRRFIAQWGTAYFQAGSSLRKFSILQADSIHFDLLPAPYSFGMSVGPEGLAKVILGGKVLSMNQEPAAARTPAVDFQGDFGIYVHTTNGVIRDARYLFHEEP